MKRSGALLILIILFYFSKLFCGCFTIAEHAPWDCPECGRTGNPKNYCGGCGYPAPWKLPQETTGKVRYSGVLKIWVAEAEFTKEQVEAFKTLHPEYAGINVIVEVVSEGDVSSKVITDVKAAADLFSFPQDQLARLVMAGALEEVASDSAEIVKSENDDVAVNAVTIGKKMYAYPLTSDNGFFLYYDKSVVSDPSDLDAVLADCEKAGKSFYFEINSGWYQSAFFIGAGCQLSFDTDNDGNFVKMKSTYASKEGVKALKAMINLSKSPAFKNGSSFSTAINPGAIVDGTWDSIIAKKVFGNNYAAAKLPTVDGWQLGGFGGFKMLGVKPQEDEAKLDACNALAAYLSSEEIQLARYNAMGWGPSNLNAQKSKAVQADVALAALTDQLQYTIPQGQYPSEYWNLASRLGNDIIEKKYDNLDDIGLMVVLKEFETTCEGYLTK